MKRARQASSSKASSRRGKARRGSTRRRLPTKGEAKARATPPSAALIHLQQFFNGVASLVPQAKKLFDETSTSPPSSANKQTRFANKLDALAVATESLLDDYAASCTAVAGLPVLAKCKPGDALAKRIVAGLKATRVADRLRSYGDEIQRLATQARQSLSPEELREQHKSFEELVKGLSEILDLAQSVRRLIDKHRERSADTRSEADLRRLVLADLQTGSKLSLKKLVDEFDSVFKALDQVDAATLGLVSGIATIVGHQGRLTKAVRDAEMSVIEQQAAIRLHLRDFEEHARTFITAIKESEEYRELAALGEASPFAAVPSAVTELVAVLQTRLGISLTWLDTIEKRHASTFIFPGALLGSVSTVAQQLRAARDQLNQYVQRNPGATTGDAYVGASAVAVEEGALSGLGDAERSVLEQIMAAHDRGEPGTTINVIMAETGLKYATVRRILTQRLGPSLVRPEKQSRRGGSRGRGQASSSPPDIYSVPEPMRTSCRRYLDAARKTP